MLRNKDAKYPTNRNRNVSRHPAADEEQSKPNFPIIMKGAHRECRWQHIRQLADRPVVNHAAAFAI
ncbi:unnamed protein product [Ceratitis capitata]|uniref:(Mediterranean fruit fly) hypothetical protein n=1 Tax=Ceratitis capitata TaxID=7213 RepID=A0A811V023_CERCA|nr:unnamed protein product [Ceratitis capitata]